MKMKEFGTQWGWGRVADGALDLRMISAKFDRSRTGLCHFYTFVGMKYFLN